jgi:hypothetical protein
VRRFSRRLQNGIKRTLWIRNVDVYFEFTEERNGRTVEMLRFKLFQNAMNIKKLQTISLLELIPLLQSLCRNH